MCPRLTQQRHLNNGSFYATRISHLFSPHPTLKSTSTVFVLLAFFVRFVSDTLLLVLF